LKPGNTPGEILEYILFVFLKRKFLILFLFISTLMFFVFGTFLVTPQWEATTKILVLQNPKQQMILFKDLASPSPHAKNYVHDLVQILKSKAFGKEIVKEFKLDELKRQKAQNPSSLRDRIKMQVVHFLKLPFTVLQKAGILEEKPPDFFASALKDLLEDMQNISVKEETSTIFLEISAESPELAVNISNALSQKLLKKTEAFETQKASETFNFLKEQLKTVQASLDEAENDLFIFKKNENIIDLASEKDAGLERLETLKTELEMSRKEVALYKAKQQALKEQLAGHSRWINVSEVSGINELHSEIRQDLNKIEADLAGMSGLYADEYPEVVSLRSRMEVGRKHLENEPPEIQLRSTRSLNPVYQELEKNLVNCEISLSELQGKISGLNSSVSSVTAELGELSEKEIELGRLVRLLEGLRKRYISLRDTFLELEVQQYNRISEFDLKISDPAFIPPGAEPDRPVWILSLFAGIIMGLFVSLFTPFLLEYWSRKIKMPVQMQQITEVEILGTVPRFNMKKHIKKISKTV